ncbi:MAG: S53 family peptidase [Verrucomicrobiota bacterium]
MSTIQALILMPVVASALATSGQAANGRQTLSGHVPEVAAKLQPVGRLEGSRRLKLAIGLAPRDEPGLDSFLQELYDPASPNYRHYLTPEEFTGRFCPTEQDYQALIDYAKASGLNVIRQNSNRVVLDVEGSVADIEKALQVTLRTYPHPNEARTFYAPDVEPSLALGVSVLHIAGLDNYALPHPKHRRHSPDPNADQTARDATPKEGTAPGSQLWGKDFRNAYVPGASLNGAGQNVGLLEFEGYYANDITDYENAIGMPINNRPHLVIVPLDGGATPEDGGDNGEECSIDIEMAVSIAPGLSNIYVFETDDGTFDDILESMVSYTNVLQFSCSWGVGTAQDPTSEVLFKQMAAQGQSFYNASGDDGAFVGAVEFPSDSPSITQVGGTTMTDGGAPSYPWESEVVWAWESGPTVSGRDASSSSGGISTYYPIPSWQTNISMKANLGSTTMRNTPDVAANADNCYIYSDDGQPSGGWGGTSCAAPLWAGFTALLNQQAAARGAAPVGFLNPALYALASGSNYTNYFHDITSGNDTWRRSPSQFYAAPGYDLCCGLGTMNGTNLINALVGTILPPTLLPPARISGGLTLTWSTLPGFSYQLQFISDLGPTNWVNFGSSITATGPVTTASDSVTNSQRFYRVMLLP